MSTLLASPLPSKQPPACRYDGAVCYKRGDEVIFYSFDESGAKIVHLFGVKDLQWEKICCDFADFSEIIKHDLNIYQPATTTASSREFTTLDRNQRLIQGLVARGAKINFAVLKSCVYSRELVTTCFVNRSVAQHFRMAMILLHNPDSPFAALDIDGVLCVLFGYLMEHPLPRHMFVALLRDIVLSGQRKCSKAVEGVIRLRDSGSAIKRTFS